MKYTPHHVCWAFVLVANTSLRCTHTRAVQAVRVHALKLNLWKLSCNVLIDRAIYVHIFGNYDGSDYQGKLVMAARSKYATLSTT